MMPTSRTSMRVFTLAPPVPVSRRCPSPRMVPSASRAWTLRDGQVEERKGHSRALRYDAQKALATGQPAGIDEFFENDVDGGSPSIAFRCQVCEPALVGYLQAKARHPVVQGFSEPLRRYVGQQPIDVLHRQISLF